MNSTQSIGTWAGVVMMAACSACSSAASPDEGDSTRETSPPPAGAAVQADTGSAPKVFLPAGGTLAPLPAGNNPFGFDYPATLVGTSGNVTVYYDPSLGAPGLSNAQALLDNVTRPYNDMQTFFGIPGGAVSVVIVPLSAANDGGGGAYHYGCDFTSGGVLYLDATFGQTTTDPLGLEIALFVAELSESFMGPQGAGWGCGSSNGEGLSRYLAEHESPTHALDRYATASHWVSADFPDWVDTTAPTDRDAVSTGAAVLYLYWMRSQGYTVSQITQAGGSTLAANYQNLTGRTTAYADLKAAAQAVPVRSDNPFTMPELLWQNPTSGQLGAWLLHGATVTGTEPLSWQCGSGCSNSWNVVDTIADNTILWDNPTTGVLASWVFDDSGTVYASPGLSWTCDAASGCSSSWKPIGRVWYNATCPGTNCVPSSGLLWFDADTGALVIWKLLGGTVTGTQSVSWTCGGSCAAAWQPVSTADFNNDGNSDILWYNQGTGQLASWLLDASSNVIGTQFLSSTCSASSGCASSWRLVGAADVNQDGNVDLLWHNASTGQLLNWLLDGNGDVTGTPTLSWTCDTTSGCASAWKALGYVQFP
jgi:hypothetical protein